ncbi:MULTISPECIES: TRAP transporter small permease [Nisaea]|uniref:TRAP transporter small permease n=1 Tax=Nisaea TaxID=390876 RepID=UPI0004035ED1|nr:MULTISPECIES: TRAP transporter small permease subunit [Nisaea]
MAVLATRLARLMALLGGAVLLVLIAITCVSVLGRGLNTFGHSAFLTDLAPGLAEALLASGVGAVTGDFEIVEAGIAFAIFAFLPICQLKAGHATVDIFTDQLPAGVNRGLIAFWEVALTLVILLISWRLFEGLQSKYRYGETTFLLQFPVWWAYGASFAASVIAGLIALYAAGARIAGLLVGRDVVTYDGSIRP